MKRLEIEQMEVVIGGGERCQFVTWGFIGIGSALMTAGITAPLGIVIGGIGAFSLFAGGCG